jgi:hypothetical protein
MGFLSKIKKGGSETSPDVVRTRKLMAQPEAKVADTTRRARAPIETIGCDSNKGVEIADKIDSPREAKPKALVATGIETKDFWPTLNNDEISSDGSAHTESSESSETTQNSLFSAHVLKTTVGRWAGKITEKLNSTPYETLDDGTECSKDKPERLAHVQRK